MLPRKIKAFQMFVDGTGYVGEGEEATIPKLTRKMEEYRSGGMQGPIGVDLGQEKAEMELTFGEYAEAIIKTWGICDHKGVKFRIMVAAERDDEECEVTPIEIVVHGRISEIDSGTWKGGDMSTMKIKVEVGFFEFLSNGESLIKFDLENLILVVGGKDLMAKRRAAIGM
jgi:P2 family phage contractile tail tube protein